MILALADLLTGAYVLALLLGSLVVIGCARAVR